VLRVIDEHSIQAPFAYEFYVNLKRSMRSSKANQEIEHERKNFLEDHSIISGEDLGAGSRLNNAARVSTISSKGISSQKACIFLHNVAKLHQVENCIELGTSLGIATAYIATVSSVENVYTFEGNQGLIAKAKHLFKKLDLHKIKIFSGNIDDELPRFLQARKVLDMAIIDANHTKEALLRYYHWLQPKMQKRAIIFVDDIRWSNDMYAGWKQLVGKKEVSVSFEFANFGLLFFEMDLPKQHYVLSI